MRKDIENAVVAALISFQKSAGLTRKQLAEKLSWSPSDVSDTLNRKKPLGDARRKFLEETLGEQFRQELSRELASIFGGARSEEQQFRDEDGYSIPLVTGSLSAGTGVIPLDEVQRWLWIPKEFLKSPASYECRYAAIKVDGNSMEPILEDGEIVVIDRAERDMDRLGERSVYAVKKDHENGVVKHLKLIPKDNILELISANAQWVRKHGFEYIKLDEVEENPIIGKVVFSFRRWR